MSLADELLHDLEEGEDENYEIDDEIEEADQDTEMKEQIDKCSIRFIAKLLHSEVFHEMLMKIEFFQEKGIRNRINGPVEADPEYQLIVEANNMTVEIDNEIAIIHKYVRDIYHKRFPELESLVPVALDYLKTVKELGNEIIASKSSEPLSKLLTQATIMVVSVTASTTQGEPLDINELQQVFEACNMAINLIENKNTILNYVESRMMLISPNIASIVGSCIAAKLMGVAGGLTSLSKMPACNILLIGSQKKTLSGFSSTALNPHTGFVFHSDIVQRCPPELRRKAAKIVANKVALASRVDMSHESQDGTIGELFRKDIEEKLSKALEPPTIKQIKPLPAPVEPPRKKRGGRRYRKMKERLGMSELRKAANRMQFGEIEEDAYQEDLGFSLGSIGQNKTGRLRAPPVDSKTKAKISKSLQTKLSKQGTMSTWGGTSTVKKVVAGTASSVAFTPLQGLEIVNPEAAEKKIEELNAKYFSATATFNTKR